MRTLEAALECAERLVPRLLAPSLSTFLQAPHCAGNVLSADQARIARRFAESKPDMFDGVPSLWTRAAPP